MEWESILCPALMVLAVVLFALRRSLLRFITCASVIIAFPPRCRRRARRR